MIHYLGHQVNPVGETIRSNRNALKLWEYGYNAEFDVIIISKDGTLGNVFYVNGIQIGFPEAPKDRKHILNWDKTERNQKWKRKEMPKGLNERTQYDPKFEDYIKEEIRRRREGIFVYIKGEAIYMPGGSYFFYQWNMLDEGYPFFRIIQNELLIYWEACIADPRCYGMNYAKNRRWGWSAVCNSEHINSGTSNENKEIGIISKSGKDAKKLFNRLVRTFKKLPPFFMPVWDGTTTPKTELVFSEPTRKKRQTDTEDDIEEGLDTLISWHNTTLNAMDGDKIFRSSIDECGKWAKDCPFEEYWRIVKTSHRQGKRIVGKSMVGSTLNSKKKGGLAFQTIYNQSDPTDRNKNGQTVSGLYNLFIDTVYGWEGYIDTYGFAIIEDPKKPVLNDLGEYTTIGAITHWQNEVDALKDDPEALNEFLRQNPRKIEHAFRDAAGDCAFDLSKLIEQEEHNTYESNHDDKGSDEIERGNLMWKNGVLDTEVIWSPDPDHGKFWIRSGCHPPEEFRNRREKKYINGVLAFAPIGGHIGTIGADPYNRTLSADGRGSLGALSLSTRMNTTSLPNNEFIVEYIDRAKKVEFFFEDALMLAIYYSTPILGELSNEAFLKHIKDRGYRHFSMNNPFKHFTKLSYTERDLGGAPPQNNKISDQQFYAVEAYVNDYVGVAREASNRSIGEIGSMVFNRTLEQWKEVDLQSRTKYDAYIASSLSLIGNQQRVLKKDEDTTPRRNPFQQYDNSRTISKAV